jgi:hypothetical protein
VKKDNIMNRIDIDLRMLRSIINGEIPGARRTILFLLAAIIIWFTGMYYSSGTTRLEQTYRLQQGRLVTLNELAVQYRQLIVDTSGNIKTATDDLMPVFSQIVEGAGLRDRLIQISLASRGVTVQMERLYAEDLIKILNELTRHGIRVYASELRAMPYQDNRLFVFTATLEVES